MDEDKWGHLQIIIAIIALIITSYGLISSFSEIHAQQQQIDTVKTLSASSISVNSSPDGASIYLDNGTYIGVTPRVLNDIEPGSHIITLKLSGYEEYSQTVSVDTGKQTPLLVNLTSKDKTSSSILVNSYPLGASIYLDDTYEGETPKILNDIELGSHIITLKLSGYEDYSQTISVEQDKALSLSYTLISEHSYGETTSEGTTSEGTTTSTPAAEIKNVWFETDNETKNGVTIHVVYTVYNLKGEKFTVSAPFYNALNGEKLTDTNGEYGVDGKVEVDRSFTAIYVENSFNDYNLFIPNKELHLNPGTAILKFNVAIKYKDQILAVSDWKYFTFEQN